MSRDILEKIQTLTEDGGFTLEGYHEVTHRDGYQVGFRGIETRNPIEATQAVERYRGDCGVWFSKGIYYIDKSFHFRSRKQAKKQGIKHNQQSIYDWRNNDLIWL